MSLNEQNQPVKIIEGWGRSDDIPAVFIFQDSAGQELAKYDPHSNASYKNKKLTLADNEQLIGFYGAGI